MNVPLKIAIFKAGKTQRQISLEALIPEGRLSSIVRGAWPSTSERTSLAQVLGGDYLNEVEVEVEHGVQAEARSRR